MTRLVSGSNWIGRRVTCTVMRTSHARRLAAPTGPKLAYRGRHVLSQRGGDARCHGSASATRKPRLLWQKWGGSALRVAQRQSPAVLLQPPPRTAKPRLGSPPVGSVTAPFGYGP